MRLRPAPPLWFCVCAAAALALAVRAFPLIASYGPPAGGHAPETSIAWFGFLIPIIGAIWNGLQVAAKVTLTALSWSVKALWLFATTTANGLKALGLLVARGVTEVWEFFEATYEHILKPAWLKFWRWFDKFRRWLDDTFGPVIAWLRELRDNLIGFWNTYVRPWLDLIDVTRKVLRVLGSLGLGWARALDARLAEITDAIERPFRLLLSKINEVINAVNAIADGFGLLQRVALIRSLERDARYAARALFNWRVKPITAAEQEATRRALGKRTEVQVRAEFSALVGQGQGPLSGLASEMAATWRTRLGGR